MSLAQDPALARERARLAPHARSLLEAAAAEALRLHADEVTLEHLLAAAMADEDCGAHALVLHAFADPETIREETIALAPGVMVVASGATLPFSPRALAALLAAREAAPDEVTPEALLVASVGALAESARGALVRAGYALELRTTRLDDPAGRAARGTPLFARFSGDAKRALSAANRAAAESRLAAIAPAQLVVGCLRVAEALAEQAGLGAQRARLVLAAESVDPTPLEERALPAAADLARFLGRLPAGADSVGMLAELLVSGREELVGLLGRHKVTPALVERGAGAFRDPEGELAREAGRSE